MEYFKQKLLLVEDAQKLSSSLITYYQQQGFVVNRVTSGKAAVDYIIRYNPHIVHFISPVTDMENVDIHRMVSPYFTGIIIWNDSHQNGVALSWIEYNKFQREPLVI